MNNQGKQLEVRLYGRKVGTLRPRPRNGLVFQYDKNYIESPEAVPLGTRSALNERPWTPTLTRTWFEGLLPEGARRATLAQALGTVNVDTWTLLELAGDECAGAVQVVAPDHTENPRLFELDDDTLETLLQPPTTPFPEHHRAARLSLAGAQEKIVLVREPDGQWSLPVDGHPSTHILKPPHPEFPGLVHNEHWCMEVTRQAGIETARTTIERIANKDVLVVQRYDRTRDPIGRLKRIHQQDLAQALGSRTKYQDEGFPNTYNLAGVPGVEPSELFDRIIVNWLVGNCDAHAKNYSILEPGTPRAALAPAYDIVSTEAYEWLKQVMGTSIGTARTLKEVTANSVDHMGRRIGVEDNPARRASRIAQRVLEAIERCQSDGLKPGPVPVHKVLVRAMKVTEWGEGRVATRRETAATKAARLDLERREAAAKPAAGPENNTPRRGRGPGC